MRPFAVLAILIAGAPGCASQRTMRSPLSAADAEVLNQTIGATEAVVEYGAPTEQCGTVHVAANGLSLRLQSPGHADEIPIGAVRRIEVPRSRPAIVLGVLFGATAGLVGGILLAPEPCKPSDSCLGLDFTLPMAVTGAVIGAAAGAVVGIVAGRGTTYTLSAAP
jgi:hypothetical protein